MLKLIVKFIILVVVILFIKMVNDKRDEHAFNEGASGKKYEKEGLGQGIAVTVLIYILPTVFAFLMFLN